MADNAEAPDLYQWLRTRAAVEKFTLDEEDIADLASRLARAHASLARLHRYDLTGLDYAVQPPTTRRPA